MHITKYNASGNDFLITHTFVPSDRSALAARLCNRTSGIGADGFIVLLPHEKYDFQWEFYNLDGSDAAMCGNGARAAALYAFDNSLAQAQMQFLTGAGLIRASVSDDAVETELSAHKVIDNLIVENGAKFWLIDTGVPHLVTIGALAVFDALPLNDLRRKYNANVNVAYAENGALRVRSFERGVEGETLACGTGMAACFVRALAENLVKTTAKVYPKSGAELTLSLLNDRLHFKGAVKKVFATEIICTD